MKQAMAAFLFCVLPVLGNELRAATLPDACGDDKVKFDVTTQKGQPAPAPPTAGKAQIVFIENAKWNDTVRFAMDGAWVGADRGNSYFTLDVTPGMHHLCASWQGGAKEVDLAPLIAESGTLYYFAFQLTTSDYHYNFGLSQLNDDQGRYRVKEWKRSTSKPLQN